MNHKNHTALVTGANSGFGFETAVLLAQQGYGRIILACRSEVKSEQARKELINRVGKDVFSGLTIDVTDLNASKKAAQQLHAQGQKIDLLILNAGLGSQTLKTSAQGIEITLAASLFGHHMLTMELLATGSLSNTARIVIAGSEATRGNLPGMKMPNYKAIQKQIGGSLDDAMDAIAQGKQPIKYNMNTAYVNAKCWVSWWAAALANKLPSPMVVVSVSPGSAPDTGLSRNMPAFMRLVMFPMLKVIGPLMKMAAPISQGAQRYVDAGEFTLSDSGKFYASPAKVLVGPMQAQVISHISDTHMQQAIWNSVVRLTRADVPAPLAQVK
ncbi:MAG: SDR family NAD(P)-dependent oxidoreductase [Bermanella sp.]